MGKHNGKARKSGISVGSALISRARKEGRTNGAASHMYTTAPGDDTNMQSVIERNDLEEMMAMASLADKDFSAEKQNVVVISTGAVAPRDSERAAAERAEAEARHAHRLVIPRRPAWDAGTTPAALDAAERASFLDWRRALAALEGEERLILTPFEKNLEVWRQLWRVLERSDVVVQVVDARDPLTYASPDLEAYAQELHAAKHTVLLLNKADLLPPLVRLAWARYFRAQGRRFAFWSAKAAADAQRDDEDEAPPPPPCRLSEDEAAAAREGAAVLGVDELLSLLLSFAREAVTEAAAKGLPRGSHGDRLVVGLTGYPNVGKSSTINALFGAKKTAVAPTPGKTKHFQTLNISEDLQLCDCPGLVMPQYAHSRADMVAAGVIPIDRLTDVRAPVGAIAQRISKKQLSAVYSINFATPKGHASAVELLRALALTRGWVVGSGLPDETRAGRRLLKDYIDGKLLACRAPPEASPEVVAVVAALAHGGMAEALACRPGHTSAPDSGPAQLASVPETGTETSSRNESPAVLTPPGQPNQAADEGADLDVADLDLLQGLQEQAREQQEAAKPRRAAHKFQKKPARSKGSRGLAMEAGAGDGTALPMGKRGGLVRIVSAPPPTAL